MRTRKRIEGPRPCGNCFQIVPHFARDGECSRCATYRKKRGVARPYGALDGRAINPRRLELNAAWKGDAAKSNSKRERIRSRLPLGPCERCGKPGKDRHHVDGNTGNNHRSNIQILCWKCHRTVDGRLARATEALRAYNHARKENPQLCQRCGQRTRRLRRGQCSACTMYERRTGQPRPAKFFKPDAPPLRW